jgi:kinesin family protein 11
MNKRSSRSHCLFSLTVESKERAAGGMVVERIGKLHMCDLAGSECAKTAEKFGLDTKLTPRGASFGEEGRIPVSRELERRNINQSLLTLGRVISALKAGDSRIPYRDSKVTRLLQVTSFPIDSFLYVESCLPNGR